jgi:hypothetical protein
LNKKLFIEKTQQLGMKLKIEGEIKVQAEDHLKDNFNVTQN